MYSWQSCNFQVWGEIVTLVNSADDPLWSLEHCPQNRDSAPREPELTSVGSSDNPEHV